MVKIEESIQSEDPVPYRPKTFDWQRYSCPEPGAANRPGRQTGQSLGCPLPVTAGMWVEFDGLDTARSLNTNGRQLSTLTDVQLHAIEALLTAVGATPQTDTVYSQAVENLDQSKWRFEIEMYGCNDEIPNNLLSS